jgi:hypothetical protein
LTVLKAPPKQPKTTVVQIRLDNDARMKLTKYAEFLDCSPSYVVTEVPHAKDYLVSLMAMDKMRRSRRRSHLLPAKSMCTQAPLTNRTAYYLRPQGERERPPSKHSAGRSNTASPCVLGIRKDTKTLYAATAGRSTRKILVVP